MIDRLYEGSSINLTNELKSLNDKKQFKKTLAILDQHDKNNITTPSNFLITQGLQACAQMGDLQRGKIIHNRIAHRVKDDIYLSTTLVQMYMECNDSASGQSLFDSTKNKTPSMYGSMMK
ncbi:unnamed protein product, partial [Rotaria magnacalcarata]